MDSNKHTQIVFSFVGAYLDFAGLTVYSTFHINTVSKLPT